MKGKLWGVGIVSVVLAGASMAQTVQGSGCASTPAGAVELARAGQASGASAALGYRVESVRWDAVQRRTWAVIRSCDHAERPTLTVPADLPRSVAGTVGGVAADGPILTASSMATASGPATTPVLSVSSQIAQANAALPVVHAGDVVRLWRADVQAHIELMATAEENGAMGAKVRLRLLTPKDADGQYGPPKYLAGIVRGPADVEMEQ